ncbi:MAG: 5 nucleotidase, deoxy (Pyrimidine), cytosolic type protein [Candidatus Parcubacteria bacterium]|jgi:hypothetical protein
MKRPVLFFDFDGLKFDTTPAIGAYINKRYGIHSVASDYVNNPRFNKIINRYLGGEVTNEDDVYLDFAENFLRCHETHQGVEPLPGVTTVLPRLAERYELWTVTARQTIGLPVILGLLDTHVPNCISGVHCVWEYTGDKVFKERSKRDFIARFEGDKVAFVDDSVPEILNVQEILPSFLFDPHGVNDSVTGISNRVRSWQEIGELFL